MYTQLRVSLVMFVGACTFDGALATLRADLDLHCPGAAVMYAHLWCEQARMSIVVSPEIVVSSEDT